ncbi:RsbRD N-terminal domain-containing protein [Desulfobacterales bacterium HSG17]|nr:RsbRD N-terminal domain-containing protein [Desulfobacterales bacterium HSG17]
MNLDQLINENQTKIVNAWFNAAADTYKPDTSKFIKGQSDAFHNPVGAHLKEALKDILATMLQEKSLEEWHRAMDMPIRIRAVQSFDASEAVAFVFLLKNVLRQIFKKELKSSKISLIMDQWDAKIDRLALVAFDRYVACREKIFDLKANESKKRTLRAFERAGLLRDLPDDDKGLRPIK